MSVRVVCIGGANVDRTARCGPLVMGSSNPVVFTQSSGGVARNVAENLARLGMDVSLITIVGDDREGEFLLSHAAETGIKTEYCARLKGRSTGSYTAILDAHGELQLGLSDMEIMDFFHINMVEKALSLLDPESYVFADANLPVDILKYLADLGKRKKYRLIVDPVSVEKSKKITGSLDGCHILLPNRLEASAIAGQSGTVTATMPEIGRICMDKGLESLVIKLGESGVYCHAGGKGVFLDAYPAKRVEVTGAGDSLAAGLIYGLCTGHDLLHAVDYGLKAASITLESAAAVSPEISADHLENFRSTR